jgi:AcrR family transcriptional regulator
VHHFGNKEGRVAAVDEAALQEFGAACSSGEPAQGLDLLRQRSEQTARVMREHPEACAYLGRALVEGTPGSARLFRLLIAGGRAEIDTLVEQAALRREADRLWVTLQHFFLIWAPLSFMPLLEQEALGGPLLDKGILDRWVTANGRTAQGGGFIDESVGGDEHAGNRDVASFHLGEGLRKRRCMTAVER